MQNSVRRKFALPHGGRIKFLCCDASGLVDRRRNFQYMEKRTEGTLSLLVTVVSCAPRKKKKTVVSRSDVGVVTTGHECNCWEELGVKTLVNVAVWLLASTYIGFILFFSRAC